MEKFDPSKQLLDTASKEVAGFLKPVKNWLYVKYFYQNDLIAQLRKKQVDSIVENYDPEPHTQYIYSKSSIKKFFEEIENETKKIKLDDLQYSNKVLIGTMIDASQYFLEEEYMRKKYAKLIAATMDKTKNDLVHRSFARTLEEVSPIEIEILKEVYNKKFFAYCEDILIHMITLYKDGKRLKENPVQGKRRYLQKVIPFIVYIDSSHTQEELQFDLSGESGDLLQISLSILLKTGLIRTTNIQTYTLNDPEVGRYQRAINNEARKYVGKSMIEMNEIKNNLKMYYNLQTVSLDFKYESKFAFYELTEYGKNLCSIILKIDSKDKVSRQ